MNHSTLHRSKKEIPFSKDPARSFTLPARYYTSAEIYDLEKPAIFYKSWHYAGHVSQVAEPRSYFTTAIHQQNLFVVRGDGGTLRTFYNVCAHRGHELLKASGKIKRLITCPYHAWSYDVDGTLHARNSENVEGFNKRCYLEKSNCILEGGLSWIAQLPSVFCSEKAKTAWTFDSKLSFF